MAGSLKTCHQVTLDKTERAAHQLQLTFVFVYNKTVKNYYKSFISFRTFLVLKLKLILHLVALADMVEINNM